LYYSPTAVNKTKNNTHNFNNFALFLIYLETGDAGKSQLSVKGTIIGGQRALVGYFPWQVYMWLNKTYSCGGSLISSNFVLSAAHCAV